MLISNDNRLQTELLPSHSHNEAETKLPQAGFTLIELVMIIVILGVLSTVAIPKYFNFQTQATVASENGVVGGIRSGIHTFYVSTCAAGTCAYPVSLDNSANAACTALNPCFGGVMREPITEGWNKVSAVRYIGPTNTTYTYTVETGTFQ